MCGGVGMDFYPGKRALGLVQGGAVATLSGSCFDWSSGAMQKVRRGAGRHQQQHLS